MNLWQNTSWTGRQLSELIRLRKTLLHRLNHYYLETIYCNSGKDELEVKIDKLRRRIVAINRSISSLEEDIGLEVRGQRAGSSPEVVAREW